MARPSRSEMRQMAESSERLAARSQSNAESARRAANDPTLSDAERKHAAATVSIAKRYAQEHREDAAKLRAGYLPGEDW